MSSFNNAGMPLSGSKQMRMTAMPITSSRQSEPEHAAAHAHGRQDITMALSLDAMTIGAVILAITLSHFEGYDMFLFALHLPHLFTVLLAYVIVNYSNTVVDLLRILVLFYAIAFCVDCLVIVIRAGFLFHAETQQILFAQAVRVAIAGTFIFTDSCGIVFSENSRAAAYTLQLRTDEKFQSLVEQVHRYENSRGVAMPGNNNSPV